MIVILPVVSLLAGLSIASVAWKQIQSSLSSWREAYFLGLLMFEGLVLLPGGGYLLAAYPEWSLLYWVDTIDGLSALGLGVFGSLICAFFGYQLANLLNRQKRFKLLLGGAIGIALLLIVFIIFSWDRFGQLRDASNLENAQTLFSANVGIIFAFAIPAIIGGWLFLLILFFLENKKVRRAESIVHLAPLATDSSAGAKAMQFMKGLNSKPPSSQRNLPIPTRKLETPSLYSPLNGSVNPSSLLNEDKPGNNNSSKN